MTQSLVKQLLDLSEKWRQSGLPSRQELLDTADRLERQSKTGKPSTESAAGPILLTATLDDAMGQGLDIIERFATLLHCRVQRLGLLLSSEEVVDACRRLQPDILGMTVLQFDTEEELADIANRLPPDTCFIAGGPVFRPGGDFARRCGIHQVIRDVGAFVCWLANRQQEGTSCANRQPRQGRILSQA
jgi:methylmalonyl-CoA mutase cobalamin-binding subunit